jgi:hypothetical protein
MNSRRHSPSVPSTRDMGQCLRCNVGRGEGHLRRIAGASKINVSIGSAHPCASSYGGPLVVSVTLKKAAGNMPSGPAGLKINWDETLSPATGPGPIHASATV